jgi:hypothetical protein
VRPGLNRLDIALAGNCDFGGPLLYLGRLDEEDPAEVEASKFDLSSRVRHFPPVFAPPEPLVPLQINHLASPSAGTL